MKIKLILGMAALSVAASVLAANEPQIIPLPQNLTRHEGFFKLAPDMRIYTDPASIKTGVFLAGQLHTSTGWRFQIRRKTPDMAVTDGQCRSTCGLIAKNNVSQRVDPSIRVSQRDCPAIPATGRAQGEHGALTAMKQRCVDTPVD